jgi:hypothetical protein
MQPAEQPHIDYKHLYEQQLVVMEKLTQQLAEHLDKEAALSLEIAKLRWTDLRC